MSAAQRQKALGQAIPSAFSVQDPAARSVLEALRQAVLLLVDQNAAVATATKATTASAAVVGGVAAVEAGNYITVQDIGGGKVKVSCTLSPPSQSVPVSQPPPSLATCTDVTLAAIADKNFLRYESSSSMWKNIAFPIPNGTAEGQIQVWDAVNSVWVSPTVGTLAEGDVLTWDATNKKWTKITPTQITVVTDWQYDTSTHKFQKKTRTVYGLSPGSESSWTDVTGAQADQGVIP